MNQFNIIGTNCAESFTAKKKQIDSLSTEAMMTSSASVKASTETDSRPQAYTSFHFLIFYSSLRVILLVCSWLRAALLLKYSSSSEREIPRMKSTRKTDKG